MATEFYVFADFVAQGGTDADLFTLEIETRAADPGLDSKLQYSEKTPAGSPTGVTFTFTSALTGPESTALDAVVAAHLGTATVPPPPNILIGTPVDGQIYVYDSGAAPEAGFVNVIMSGDAAIDETGAVTIDNFTAGTDGFAPASGGGSTNFLRADGTWAAPPQPTFGEYSGTFDASVGTFPGGAGTNNGDWFNTVVAGTVDGEPFAVGDLLIAIVNSPSNTTFAGNWTRVPNIGAADVTGPASATDNAVALFDGTSGKVIKDSLVTIDGSGNISTPGTVDGLDVGALDTDLETFSLPANTTISAFGSTLVDDADAATARTTLGVDPAGTDNSTDVTLAGTPDYITIVGQVITRNQIDLTADVTGVLPVANGGTGLTSGPVFTEDVGFNIFGGTGAGASLLATGLDNFIAGQNAGANVTSGDENVFIGLNAGNSVQTAPFNIAIGGDALGGSSNNTFAGNIAIGKNVLSSNGLIAAGNNIGIGQNALINVTTGDDNIGIGANTGDGITTGIRNTVVGSGALAAGALTGNNNVAIGRDAMDSSGIAGASENTAVGHFTLKTLTTGDNNVVVGRGGGNKITAGSNNIILGKDAGPTTDQSSKLFIDITETDTPLIGADFAGDTIDLRGEVSFNDAFEFPNTDGLAGQVLTTDGLGNVDWAGAAAGVFGMEFEESKSLGQVSTTSGTYITAFSFTTASVPAGDYMIMWFSDAGSDTDKASAHRVTLDGSEISQIDWRIKEGVEASGIAWTNFSGHRIVTLTAATHTLAFQYEADNTAYYRNMQFTIYRVA